MGRWVFFVLVIAMVAAALGRWRHRRDRASGFVALCGRAGLEYSPIDPFGDTLWLPFHWLGAGRWKGAENVIWAGANPAAIRAFDLITIDDAGGDTHPAERRFSCAAVPLPFGCPRLEIRPRDGLDTALDALTGDDVTLELEEFNRRFQIRCADRRFAVAFCDQRMMRVMLELPRGVTIAVNEDRMLLRAPLLPPAEVVLLFEAARAIASRVPAVVASLYPPRPAKGPHEDRWMQGRWSPDPIGEEASQQGLGPGTTKA